MNQGPTMTPEHVTPAFGSAAHVPLIAYYEAIERASADMLEAARLGDWDQVVKIEGACVLLISQLQNAARDGALSHEEQRVKVRIMQRIVQNDARIRDLAEPWLSDLDQVLRGGPRTLH